MVLQSFNFRASSSDQFITGKTMSTRMSLHCLLKCLTLRKKKFPVRGHSKLRHLGYEGGFPKKVTKIDIGGRGCIHKKKKMMPLTQNFLFPFFLQLDFCSSVFNEALIILQRVTTKTCKRSSVRLRQLYYQVQSILILPLSTLLVNTCVFICKIERVNSLKLNFVIFSTSFYIM